MSNVTLYEIAEACCAEFGIELVQLRSRRSNGAPRRSVVVTARQVFISLAVRHTRTSFKAIYGFAGLASRDYGYKLRVALEEKLAHDDALAEQIERIEQRIDALHEARLAETERRAGATKTVEGRAGA